jgi:hypothetical protein
MKGHMPTKSFVAILVLVSAGTARADSTFLGLYLQGTKIGFASYVDRPDQFAGRPATRSDSHTLIDAGLLGTPLKMVTDSTTWTNKSGRPLRMKFSIESGGRSQTLDAAFGAKTVGVDVNNNGSKSHLSLTIPDGAIVDDPLTLMLHDNPMPGQKMSVWVLDPMTVSFHKSQVKIVGPSSTVVKGKKVSATLVEMTDQGTTMRVFMGTKGELIRVEGPMGIEMLPESKEVALIKPGKYSPSVDLAINTSIKTDKPISDPSHLTELKLRVLGKDLSEIPSDASQSVTKDGEDWIIDVHPLRLNASEGESVAEASASLAQWTQPSLDIPSNNPKFRELSKKLIGPNKDVRGAALAIKQYVYNLMQPNAGIGILRDASEILATKEGVCRDYAILTTTLLRAAGIPSRVVAGLVNWDGTFYYHAWSEAWDGRRWIGIDSTTDDEQLSAGHIKLAQGNVEEAFTFTFLEKARIEVLDARH